MPNLSFSILGNNSINTTNVKNMLTVNYYNSVIISKRRIFIEAYENYKSMTYKRKKKTAISFNLFVYIFIYNVTAIFGNVDSYASINYEKGYLDLEILVRNRR